MEHLRHQELKKVSTAQALQNLSGAFESCRLHFKPKPTSGLVEQQAWLKKITHDRIIIEQLTPLAELKESPQLLRKLQTIRNQSNS